MNQDVARGEREGGEETYLKTQVSREEGEQGTGRG